MVTSKSPKTMSHLHVIPNIAHFYGDRISQNLRMLLLGRSYGFHLFIPPMADLERQGIQGGSGSWSRVIGWKGRYGGSPDPEQHMEAGSEGRAGL